MEEWKERKNVTERRHKRLRGLPGQRESDQSLKYERKQGKENKEQSKWNEDKKLMVE